jgi:hypothetical protein
VRVLFPEVHVEHAYSVVKETLIFSKIMEKPRDQGDPRGFLFFAAVTEQAKHDGAYHAPIKPPDLF